MITVMEPMPLLDPSDYHRIAPLLKELPINTLFARVVVEGQTAGRVFVDDRRTPRACYVAHPYGMSLLFGSPDGDEFLRGLRSYLLASSANRSTMEWLQVYPNDWTSVLQEILGTRLVPFDSSSHDAGVAGVADGRVIRNTRVNFRFDPKRYGILKQSLGVPEDCEVIDDLDYIHSAMKGGVVPSVFWSTPEEFRERGVAFGLRHRGELVSVAFSAFVLDDYLELGIETVDRFRGRGLAARVCSVLIDYCIERGLEPVWACRLANQASHQLAMKIGFDPVRCIPYYRLPLSE